MSITNLKITLTNGQKYKFRQPDTLGEIDRNRTALFLFDNLQLYSGFTNGEVDEDGYFTVSKPGVSFSVALPFGRLVGWAYKKGKK